MTTPNLRELAEKATQGEWGVGCFADPNSKCQCKYIFSEGYNGSIATISVDNGKMITDGGNDCPRIDEARANGRYIAAANPTAILALLDEVEALRALLTEIVSCVRNPSPTDDNARHVMKGNLYKWQAAIKRAEKLGFALHKGTRRALEPKP